MASQWPPKKNTAFTLYFSLYKNDGTIIANPGTYTKKISKDGGGIADISASVTEVDTTYGLCSLVISATEMNADAVYIQIKDDTTGGVPFSVTLYTAANLMDDIKTDTTAIKVQTDKLVFTVTNQIDANVIDWKGATAPEMTGDAYARLGAPAGASVSADVAAVKAVADDLHTDVGTAITNLGDMHATDLPDIHSDLATLQAMITDIHNTDLADLHTDVAAVKTVVDDLNVTDVAAVKADTEAIKAAIITDTLAEMAPGAPPAAPTMTQLLNYLYRALRNKQETTATQHKVYDDAGTTVLFKETHSDDATTFSKGEYGA